MVRARRTVQVIPCAQGNFLAVDDRETLAGQHEEPLLRRLTVVGADRLTGLEHAEVDAELGERFLPLEVAVEPERPGVVPSLLASADHEPPALVVDEAGVALACR